MPSTRPHRPALYVKRRLAVLTVLLGVVLIAVCASMGLMNGLLLVGIALLYFGAVAVYVLAGPRP